MTTPQRNVQVVAGTTYDARTPSMVISALELAREKRFRVRLHFGNPETGQDSLQESYIDGYVGRTTGTMKCSLLRYNRRAVGGDLVSTERIVRIRQLGLHRCRAAELWRHPRYHQGKIIIRPPLTATFAFEAVRSTGELIRRFPNVPTVKAWLTKLAIEDWEWRWHDGTIQRPISVRRPLSAADTTAVPPVVPEAPLWAEHTAPLPDGEFSVLMRPTAKPGAIFEAVVDDSVVAFFADRVGASQWLNHNRIVGWEWRWPDGRTTWWPARQANADVPPLAMDDAPTWAAGEVHIRVSRAGRHGGRYDAIGDNQQVLGSFADPVEVHLWLDRNHVTTWTWHWADGSITHSPRQTVSPRTASLLEALDIPPSSPRARELLNALDDLGITYEELLAAGKRLQQAKGNSGQPHRRELDL